MTRLSWKIAAAHAKEKGKAPNPQEKELLERCLAHLEAEKALRSLPLTEAELKMLTGYQFLSLKPS